MKYPLNTTSKPVVGAQAKKLLKAVKEGKSLTNAAAQTTINRLIARRQGHGAGQKKAEIR
jgi:molybdenum-dependent DNA-binding transcriptional regulator ModE